MLGAVEVAETLGEHASLWAIRFAMLAMFIVFALQLRGASQIGALVRTIWFFGAVCALAHSIGALFSFHGGSHEAAFESTAQQTEDLLGVAVGVGLYVNYLFVAVWMGDACFRMFRPDRFQAMPQWYRGFVYGFLSFIAFNGTVVFKDGWIRWGALAAIVILMAIWFLRPQASEAGAAPAI